MSGFVVDNPGAGWREFQRAFGESYAEEYEGGRLAIQKEFDPYDGAR